MRATSLLAAVTAAVSLYVFATGQGFEAALNAGYYPARIAGDLPAGAFLVPAWLTPLSATLVHGDLMHLGFNLVMLIAIGRLVEAALGWAPMLLLYVAGAYIAALAQTFAASDPMQPLIGASGAVSALVGSSALLFGRVRAKAIGPIPAGLVNAAWLLVTWTLINWAFALVFSTAQASIAWEAHVGGFIAGLALTPIILDRR